MSLIHHVVTGNGRPPIVFVHGFACAHADWDAQVAHFSPRHLTVGVDLRGHENSPGTAEQCSIEQYGADVADVMHALGLAPAVLVGHSMGCRVVVEAALQAPAHAAAVILVDGSQFAPAMETVINEILAAPDGYASLIERWFQDMFTINSDAAVAASVLERAKRLPTAIGEKLLLDMVRYDVACLTASLADLRVPVLAVQSTYSNEKRERRSMEPGQNTPYLEMLRTRVPEMRIDIIARTGHFPQLDESVRLNARLESFIGALPNQ